MLQWAFFMKQNLRFEFWQIRIHEFVACTIYLKLSIFLKWQLCAYANLHIAHCTKGQLISKGKCSVFNSLKNKLENVNFCPSLLGQNFFGRFLGELKKTKSPFKINWRLIAIAHHRTYIEMTLFKAKRQFNSILFRRITRILKNSIKLQHSFVTSVSLRRQYWRTRYFLSLSWYQV